MQKLAFIFLLCFSTQAMSFGEDLHRKITKRALRRFGFTRAVITQLGDANIWVDQMEPLNSASHVDSESFEAASKLMRDRLREGAQMLVAGNVAEARALFGHVTHTTQDFFSHSNYVEYMPGKKIDLLNLTNPSPEVTCSKRHRRSGLTSGYFPDETKPEGKCAHSELNKDGGIIYIYHYIAAHYAKIHTRKMYLVFKDMVQNLTGEEELTNQFLTRFKSE